MTRHDDETIENFSEVSKLIGLKFYPDSMYYIIILIILLPNEMNRFGRKIGISWLSQAMFHIVLVCSHLVKMLRIHLHTLTDAVTLCR